MSPIPNTQLELFRPIRNRPRVTHSRRAGGLLESVTVAPDGYAVQVDFIKDARARCYRLLLRRDGSARVTVPQRGNLAEAREFLKRNLPWLGARLQEAQARQKNVRLYGDGLPVWFRGQPVLLEVDSVSRSARLGDWKFELRPYGFGLAVQVEKSLWNLARRELPPVVLRLADQHGFKVQSVSVRNQRTRWGSCSPKAVISLNWRLVQTPEFVRDYIVLHELAHLRHLNHSKRFWAEVRRLCPEYERAEAWLSEFGPKVI